MKKCLAILLCLMLLAPPAVAQTAENPTMTSGAYEYILRENGTAVITKYLGRDAQVSVPASLDGIMVTAIGKEAFSSLSELIGVTLPEGIRAIEEAAFANCAQLVSLALPDSLEALGDRAFRGCRGLKALTIPAGLAAIGSGAFDYCENLAEFAVSPDNPFYKAEQGVLFDVRTGTLARYPCAKPGSEYAIPEGTDNIGQNAFNYAIYLTRVTLPASLAEIGEYAFSGADTLAAIDIPDRITKIGGYAFYGCGSLKRLDIPQSVTSIADYPFGGCGSLTSINVSSDNPAYASYNGILFDKAMTTLLACPGGMSDDKLAFPEGMTAIGNGALGDCHLLTRITIPSGVTAIGGFAFNGCSGLEGISFPDSVETIQQCAFRYCGKLTDIKLPAALKEIDYAVFERCESLKSLQLPAGITVIRQSAFEDCAGLTELVIPGSVTELEYAAFRRCVNLTALTIPGSVSIIGEYAFEGCGNLTLRVTQGSYAMQHAADQGIPYTILTGSPQTAAPAETQPSPAPAVDLTPTPAGDYEYTLNEDGSAVLTKYKGSLAAVSIPAALDGYPLVEIGQNALRENENLLSLTIPEGVKTIGEYAFLSCRNLTDVMLPDTLTAIGTGAFFACENLGAVHLPAAVVTIDQEAFCACTKLAAFTIAQGNQAFTIIDGVIFDALKQTLVIYPSGKPDMTYLIPEGTTGIAPQAFKGTGYLQSVTIPQSMTEINPYAFFSCYTITAFEIPGSVKRIGDFALADCDRLVTITIPDSVTEIQDAVFYSCGALEEILAGEGNPAFSSRDGVLYDKAMTAVLAYPNGRKAEAFVIPAGVTRVADYAFATSAALKKLTFPDNLETIGKNAFRYCISLEEAVIPDSVTSIGPRAFDQCDKLTLRVREGSYAQQYAAENKLMFALISGEAAAVSPSETQPSPAPAVDLTPAPTGDYEYTLNEDGSAVLTKYRGSAVTLDIPGQLDGHPLTRIGAYAFEKCVSLQYAAIPDGVKSIGEYAFSSCGNLKELRLPQSVNQIGEWAFSLCSSLTTISIPSGVTSIGKGMFHYCTALEEITIPPGVTQIGVSAFAGCAMRSLIIPDGVLSVGEEAFSSCGALTSAAIPASVISIGQGAFAYSHYITRFTVAEGNPTYLSREGVLFDKTQSLLHSYPAGMDREDYAVPQDTQSIGAFAFATGSKLRAITLPDSVKDIGTGAFYSCGLRQVTLPPHVTIIRDGLFAYCYDLESVRIPSGVTSIIHGAFVSCDKLTLEVEENSAAHLYAAGNNVPFRLVPAIASANTPETGVPSAASATDIPTPEPESTAETPMAEVTPLPEATALTSKSPDEGPYADALFNAQYYAQMNPDLAAASGGDEKLLRTHWLRYGIHEGRRASPAFDAKWYLANNAEAADAFGSDYAGAALHYQATGAALGQAGSADFRAADYAALNPDLAAQFNSDLRALAQHYNDQGWALGLSAAILPFPTEPAAASLPQADADTTPLPAQEPSIRTLIPVDTAQTRPWPLESGALHDLRVSGRHDKETAYCGPGKGYREAGTYKTAKMTRIKGACIEGDYMLVDVDYPGVGRRLVYFRTNAFKSAGNVPLWAFSGFAASVTAETMPRFGPGTAYDTFEDETLMSGTALSVYYEESGWVFAEFMTSQGLVRGWIEAASAEADGM